VDGKKVGARKAENRFTNGLMTYLMVIGRNIALTTGLQFRSIEGNAITGMGLGSSPQLFLFHGGGGVTPSELLGTDTSVPTESAFWNLENEITDAGATIQVGGGLFGPATVQGQTIEDRFSLNLNYTFTAGTYGTNPTIGEVAFLGRFFNQTPAIFNAMISRVAAADGAFSPFATNSANALNVQDTWQPA
jgi:hypothetical protein